MADRRRYGRLLSAVEGVRDDPGLDRPHPVCRLGGHRHRRRILPPDPRPTHRRLTAPEPHMSYLRFVSRVRPALTCLGPALRSLRSGSRVRPAVTAPDAPCIDRPRLLDQNLLPDPPCEGWLRSGPRAYPAGEGPGHIPIWNGSVGFPQGLHYQTYRGAILEYEPAPQDPWPQVTGPAHGTATAWHPDPDLFSRSPAVDQANPRTAS